LNCDGHALVGQVEQDDNAGRFLCQEPSEVRCVQVLPSKCRQRTSHTLTGAVPGPSAGIVPVAIGRIPPDPQVLLRQRGGCFRRP
jgi:hypothetical protein